ncbi:MAG: 50S ribosomal protein L15 [Patescibacteria group bacterium]|jgi:large subunit ribosomal protein L15
MKLHELKSNKVNQTAKRVGRGISAGGGKTAGRGTKGQKSRSGHNIPRKFEGGQTPLVMRLHKLPGLKSHKPKTVVVTLDDISNKFKNGETVSEQTLIEKGISRKGDRVKILSTGDLKIKVSIDNVSASKTAYEKILNFRPVEKTAEKKTEKSESKELK